MENIARKKIELQANSVRISSELKDELFQKYNFPGMHVGWMIFCIENPEEPENPLNAFLSGAKFSESSPFYLVKEGDGKFSIHRNDTKYVDIRMIPRPKFYDRTTSSGVLMPLIATCGSPTHMNVVRSMKCLWVDMGKDCKFCAYKGAWGQAGQDKEPEDIAEVVEAAVNEGLVEHVSITTGTLPTKDRGFFGIIETAKAIRRRLGRNVPIKCSFEPLSDLSLMDKAKEVGIDVVSINIECFDPKVREELMPNGKGRTPLKMYQKNWKRMVEIFGRNQSFSVVLAGTGESEKSLVEGMEMVASHGIIPWLEPLTPVPGSSWEDRTPLTAEEMFPLYEQCVRIIEKEGLDLEQTKAGCVKVGVYCALKDVQRYGTT